MSNDQFNTRAAAQAGPVDRIAPVTPDDAVDLPLGRSRGLHVGGAGAITIRDGFGGTAQIISGAGQYHPIRVTRVLATGTTATGIVALY